MIWAADPTFKKKQGPDPNLEKTPGSDRTATRLLPVPIPGRLSPPGCTRGESSDRPARCCPHAPPPGYNLYQVSKGRTQGGGKDRVALFQYLKKKRGEKGKKSGK